MFCRILWNSVLAGDIGDKYGKFWSGSGGHSVCIHDCAVNYHSGSDERNIENIELSLFEIFPVYLVHRLYLSVAVTDDKYCIFGQVQGAV